MHANTFETERQNRYRYNKTNVQHYCCDYMALEGEKFKAFIMGRTQSLTDIIALGVTFVRMTVSSCSLACCFQSQCTEGLAVVLIMDLQASEETVRHIRRDS